MISHTGDNSKGQKFQTTAHRHPMPPVSGEWQQGWECYLKKPLVDHVPLTQLPAESDTGICSMEASVWPYSILSPQERSLAQNKS